MSIYAYPLSTVVEEVIFRKTANGALRAYVHAKEGTPKAKVDEVNDGLLAEGYTTIPFTIQGKPMLEVRGFKKEKSLLKQLNDHDWVQGDAKIQEDAQEYIGWKERLQKRSLQASGALYAFGDVSFFLYGLKGASPLDMAAGIFYGLPTPVLLAYGRNDQSELQIKDYAKIMAKHFREQSVKLPDDCSLDAITRDKNQGLIKNVNDLLQRYPSEFMNLSYAAAGACIAMAGAKHLKHLGVKGVSKDVLDGWVKHLGATKPGATTEMARQMAHNSIKIENQLNVGVGATTVASGLFGAVVKEKNPDPDNPAQGTL
ncbi:MAG: hypothetical protein K2Q01_03945, partial [Rickettsiales bacterium]|nr:hypothetical protein [Rickettsiales bacterium]